MRATGAATAWIAGVDGCRAGWIAVFRDLAHVEPPRVRVTSRFVDIVDSPEHPAMVAVDMPIGLPDRTGPGGRGPERLVRPLLGGRRSSVFSVPARSAVEALDYPAACAAAMSRSEPPRQVSKQAFHLFPRIRELDALLRARDDVAHRVRESHPELAFRRMNGTPLDEPKKLKSRSHPPGLDLRRRILRCAGLPDRLLTQIAPRGAAIDDLLDAIALSWVAERIVRGAARSLPDPPARDGHGLPIAIWA